MTAASKNVYIDKLNDIVNKYNNAYHQTIKMKPIKEGNDKDAKFIVGNHVRISEYKIIFAKIYNANWSEEVFVIKEIEITVS